METKKLLLIVNPNSGKARMKTELMSVVEIFSNNGFDVTVYPTKQRADGTTRALNIKQDEYDIVVVSGGDGTLNEVITGIMQTGVNVPIGYIPSGTLNEWSQGLGISRNIKKAAEDIVNGKEITLDIGKFGDKYFSYTASFGAFTSASYTTPQNVKNILGQSAYILEGVKSIGTIKPIHIKLIADEKTVEGDFLFGAVSNSMSVGGIVKYDENKVKLNDGLFEIILIKNPDNILKLQPAIDGILKREFDREGIEFLHTKKVVIEGCDGLDWTLDGEHAIGSDKLVIENIHDAIKFIVPDKERRGDK